VPDAGGTDVRRIGEDRAYAGVWIRFAALVTDIVVLSLVFFPVTRIVKGTWIMSAADHHWNVGWFVSDPLCLVFLVSMFLYFVVLEGFAGGTIGKLLLRLRVVSLNGSRAGFVRALLRNVLRVVDSLPACGILGAVLIAATPDKVRFGDRVAGMRVIHSRRTSI
jgi:uncharacterized RDD family membrane protein YckC